MKFSHFASISILLFFCSCDQLKDNILPVEESNQTSELEVEKVIPENPDEPLKPEPTSESKSEDEVKIKTPQKVQIPVEIPAPKPSTKPVQPEFSKELLKAVNNWQSIPKSVFPLSSVTIKSSVNFIAKSSAGEVIARAQKQAGEEVVALGIIGKELILSPSKNGNMRGKIEVDQTDFKQGVAYLFQLRKQQRVEYERRKVEIAKNNKVTKSGVQANKNANKNTSEDSSLFEDLPIPGDFGHGKFCICKECREKRLAATGSMK
ncbi:MAG: hypothetical protein VX609_05195 [Verrucomicrobiota bacterium]|nr:hypothetical protein [Verrucomicrobiota bacterium]